MLKPCLRVLLSLTVGLAIVVLPILYSAWRLHDIHHFYIVEDGVLYRSGQLSETGLHRIVHDHGIRTIISFRYADHGDLRPPDLWEESFCAERGLEYVRIQPDVWTAPPGQPIPAQRAIDEFLAVATDPNKYPILVHCLRGVHRTGIHCAIFRIECHRWSNEAAVAEMKALGYTNIEAEREVFDFLQRYRPTTRALSNTQRPQHERDRVRLP